MSSSKFVAVIGPVGCGKSSIVSKYYNVGNGYVSISPDHYPTGIVDGKSKNERILNDVRSAAKARNHIAIDNGGGIFLSDGGIFSDYRDIDIVAPIELVTFISKWPVTKTASISPLALAESPFMKGVLAQIERIGPCRDAYLEMVDMFISRTTQACDYRLSAGIFHINYFGRHMKVGHFKNRDTMIDVMKSVTMSNMKTQLILLMWARLNGHNIIPFVYDSQNHTVTI